MEMKYETDDVAQSDIIEQGQWANLPPDLLLDIICRVEESETTWPARAAVVSCASVCKPWRDITKEIVKTPEECGKLTFPISLKQPGLRDAPIQCFIKRNRATSTFHLYSGLTPSEDENDKLLLAAKKIRRATSTDFVISLVADDFSRASNTYVGKLRSNFLGTKFTIYEYDCQPPILPAYNYSIATISYDLNVLTRGPRKMHCGMHSIPVSSIQEGGTAPTPTSFPQCITDEKSSLSPNLSNLPAFTPQNTSLNLSNSPAIAQQNLGESLCLKNKSPRWHEQQECWCLNFRGRVTVASAKNFQLVAAVDPSLGLSTEEQEKVILQFGKIGKDVFTMDYQYPISAFQAFAICLSSFDTKPACGG